MQFFINKYPTDKSAEFYSIVEDNAKDGTSIVGYHNDSVMLSKVDANGQYTFGRTYTLFNKSVNAYRFVVCSNGDLILYGRQKTNSANLNPHVLMRVKPNGQPIWIRTLTSGNSRSPKQIIRTGKEEYALTGWYNRQGSADDVEVVKINGNGDVLNAINIRMNYDDQVTFLLPYLEWVVAVGGSNIGSPWGGFLILMDGQLKVRYTLLQNPLLKSYTEDIYYAVQHGINLLVVGRCALSNQTRTFFNIATIQEIKGQLKFSSQGIIINSLPGDERVRKVIAVGDSYYVLGFEVSSNINFVLKFSEKQQLVWAKKFDIEGYFNLFDIVLKDEKELWLSGFTQNGKGVRSPLLIKTDLDLTTCKTQPLEGVEIIPTHPTYKQIEAKVSDLVIEDGKFDLAVEDISFEKLALCPEKTFSLSDLKLVQSPFLYLQAAGSVGIESSAGIHLRWFLLRNLGDNHLPKGDNASISSTLNPYNKPNDYVCIYRALYDTKLQRKLSLAGDIPLHIIGAEKKWVYRTQDGTVFYVYFKDQQKYNDTAANVNPATNPYQFFNAYGGVIEVEIRDKLAFSVEYIIGNAGNAYTLKSELFSVEENLPLANTAITGRRLFTGVGAAQLQQYGENIRIARFSLANCELREIRLETYTDFLINKTEAAGWTPLGKFALTKNTNEAFLRLEDNSRFIVHDHWQKFNDDATVNVQNYKDRWNLPGDGLQEGVTQYISLSDNDPQAVATYQGQHSDDGSMEVSYLTLLHFAASDFHNARMLGLGHTDTPPANKETKYIFLAEYFTQCPLDIDGPTLPFQHLSMSPPTARIDERLPQLIEPLPLEYGLSVPNGTSQPLQLTDNDGYIPFGQARYIRLKAKLTTDYSQYNGFFNPPLEFSSLDYTPPVFSGVEYKNKLDSNWQKPEISHTEDFKDASPAQHFETLPLPFYEDVTKPILIHKETNEGEHEYANYAINIFSIASAVSTKTVQTDYTRFIKPNTLIPPHHAHVQLIQEESPTILTSQNEQDYLELKSNSDKTLVRLNFYYSHLHDINYGFGNQVEIFFRQELPRDTGGGVASVTNGAATDLFAWVNTQDYTYNSSGQTVIPNIPPTLVNHFKGGVFVSNENRYIIEDILLPNANGDYPRFKLRKQEDRNTVNLGNGSSGITQSYLDINAAPSDLFLVIENMAKADCWGTPNPLSFKVDIGDASWTTQQDDYVDVNGQTIEQELRGIRDRATITHTGNGVYKFVFNNYILNRHPQWKDINSSPDEDFVDWYKGIVRVKTIGDTTGDRQRKALDVLQIDNLGSGNNLELTVLDEAYDTSNNDNNIREGANIRVNFYPGYRVYLHANSGDGFDETTIQPSISEDFKKTIIGLRSVDTATLDANNLPYASKMAPPLILFAQADTEPGEPGMPAGPLYTTEPDFYGKCNYTMFVQLGGDPFAVIFYRADLNAVLHAFYKYETIYGGNGVTGIKDLLLPPDEDVDFTSRFQKLVSLDWWGNNFADFANTPLFPLPPPNNLPSIPTGMNDPNEQKTFIRNYVSNAAGTPLTEQPLIYSFISAAPDYIPRAKKQTIKDKYGKLLDPSDPAYDQAPMAKRLSNQVVQFTDFTIDGEMAKETAYFYCARQINKQMRMGDFGSMWGPVQLVNTRPPDAPIVKKVTTQLADNLLGTQTAVNFQINAYPASQNIKRLELYRAFTAVDALSPRTMTLAKTTDLATATITDGIIHLQDDFQNDPIIPYGELLFYRIVAVREVKYKDFNNTDVTKWVPSKPSSTLLTNIVDVFNPEPPILNESIASTANDELSGLVLSWNKTAHNARYFLYKMNSVGNWNKLHEVKSNDENDLSFAFADPLPKVNEESQQIYHRFKVTVENSSGLLNLREEILTL